MMMMITALHKLKGSYVLRYGVYVTMYKTRTIPYSDIHPRFAVI